jgi:hypothetical protein
LETAIRMQNQNITDTEVQLEIDRIQNEEKMKIDDMNNSINDDMEVEI